MTAIGGSIESVTIDGRRFAVTFDTDSSRKLGGTENEVQPNGDGTARIIKTATAWQLSGLVVQVDDFQGDHEFLQAVADGNAFVACSINMASGLTYQGRGIVAGELASSTASAAATLDIQGEGKLVIQSF